MMDFSPSRPHRRRGENIVPMINVVFLLLIFFLMSAQIAPPEPFDVSLPDSANGTDDASQDVLYVARDGRLAFDGATGDAALTALQNRNPNELLHIRADAGLPANTLASLLPRLAKIGITDTALVTEGQ